MKYLRSVLTGLVAAAMLPLTTLSPAQAEVDVYTTEGTHQVNGRTWRTECETYSQTERCRTDIMATVVAQVDGKFVQTTGWAFNNLTYLPKMTRAQWAQNPLGYPGAWTAEDGRKWRTECDTAATGRNGCRSYAAADVIESYLDSNGTRQFRWVRDKFIFNNIVRFATPGDTGGDPTDPPTPDPTTSPTATPTATAPVTPNPDEGYDPDLIVDVELRDCIRLEVGAEEGELLSLDALAEITLLDCAGLGIVDLSGLPLLENLLTLNLSGNLLEGGLENLAQAPNLLSLDLSANVLESLGDFPLLSALVDLDLSGNLLDSVEGLPALGALVDLDLSDNEIVDLDGLPELLSLLNLDLSGNLLADLLDDLGELLPVLESLDLQDNLLGLDDINDVLGLDSLLELLLDGNDALLLGPVLTLLRNLLAALLGDGLIVDILQP